MVWGGALNAPNSDNSVRSFENSGIEALAGFNWMLLVLMFGSVLFISPVTYPCPIRSSIIASTLDLSGLREIPPISKVLSL